MTAMICGSLAYDTVMVFDGRFKEHILPDRIHMLSVSFLVPQMRRNFGGVAGNIAYNLSRLGIKSHILATVGDDFDPYETWMRRHGLSLEYVRRVPNTYTAQAFITTDLDDNQITAFHPGAMQHSGELIVPRGAGISLGLVGPDSRDAMIRHSQQFADAGIPFIFDVGQGLAMFSGQDLEAFIDQASWVIVNDYEGQLVQDRTGLTPVQIAARCKAYVVTRGAYGSRIYTAGAVVDIPSVRAERVVDPTGCGDAYRAGIIYGLTRGLDWETTGRVGSLMGALKIAHHGTQSHDHDLADVAARFEAAFGYPL
ncbi:MAG TPA: carbohydrate kinase family protein [Steroidobacteraceae bacterium]|nr:carbohydrate kinase family protein [Steroidobacteraceae bacterium]